MEADKHFSAIAITFIICGSLLIGYAMFNYHVQTLKYIEGGYSQKQGLNGLIWTKE
jgi:hypothetical protein